MRCRCQKNSSHLHYFLWRKITRVAVRFKSCSTLNKLTQHSSESEGRAIAYLRITFDGTQLTAFEKGLCLKCPRNSLISLSRYFLISGKSVPQTPETPRRIN